MARCHGADNDNDGGGLLSWLMSKIQSDIFHVSDWKAYRASVETGEPFTPSAQFTVRPVKSQQKVARDVYEAVIASSLSASETARRFCISKATVYTYWKKAELAGTR